MPALVAASGNNSAMIKTALRKFSNSKYLYIIWLYAFRFVACKVSMDAFSLLFSKSFYVKFWSIYIWCDFCCIALAIYKLLHWWLVLVNFQGASAYMRGRAPPNVLVVGSNQPQLKIFFLLIFALIHISFYS